MNVQRRTLYGRKQIRDKPVYIIPKRNRLPTKGIAVYDSLVGKSDRPLVTIYDYV